MLTGFIYALMWPGNPKRYVGQTRKDPWRRFSEHIRAAKNGSDFVVHQAIRKHGKPVLAIVARPPVGLLNDSERRVIAVWGTLAPNGYNMTPGGDESPMLTPAVAAKHSAAMTGRVFSEAHKKALRAANTQAGKPIPEKQRLKMSSSHRRHHRGHEDLFD